MTYHWPSGGIVLGEFRGTKKWNGSTRASSHCGNRWIIRRNQNVRKERTLLSGPDRVFDQGRPKQDPKILSGQPF